MISRTRSGSWPSWPVIRLRTQTPSLARWQPLSGLGSLLRVRGSRAAPTVPPLLSLFVSNIQPVALAPTGVNVSKLIYRHVNATCWAVVSTHAFASTEPHKTPVHVMHFTESKIRLRHLTPCPMSQLGGCYEKDGSSPRTRTEGVAIPPTSCPSLCTCEHQYHSNCLVVACSLPRLTMP
jgi:hypothetical protein